MSSIVETPPPHFIRNIEWDMMDKAKFFPLSMLSSFSIRCALYPLTLIKTRLQIQKHSVMYTGMIDAYIKIFKHEGIGGLYKGFWVSSIQIVSGVVYISAYEGTRHILAPKNIDVKLRALIAGAAASALSQTIIVPFDVVSQHLMMMGAPSKGHKMPDSIYIREDVMRKGRFAITTEIVKQIYTCDGVKGFYRGYAASLCAYVPNSALWWGFYHFYQDQLFAIVPSWCSHIFVQTVAGTLGGFSTTILTNPLDVVRARLQVQRINSISIAFKDLWQEEGLKMFSKGLTARLLQSATFSFSIILGYETIKRFSVNEEYKSYIRW